MSVRPSLRSRTAHRKGDVPTPPRHGRLTYANVTASIALFVALGGTSYAAIKIPAKSVGTIQLKNRAVTNAKIAPNAVNASKLRDGSVTGADIAPGAVDGSKVRDGSLTAADIAGKVAAAVTADRLAFVQRIAVPGVSDAAPAGSYSTKGATAACPAGTFVVGGGVSLGDQATQTIATTYPSSPTAWTGDVDNFAPTTPGFTVYALCVPAAAGT